MYHMAFYSNKNTLICVLTGACTTNIVMIAIL